MTGIHLTSYYDERNSKGLAELIKEIHEVEGIKRIRLGSLEPMFLTSDFIGEIKKLPKLCPISTCLYKAGVQRHLSV